CQQGHSYPWTF
nr:immunoglobulin light chain junction region [Macaca mulatta]MOV77880.1 immunoglobulin light chain junction region [Macaca mulatta]MOV77998.1 immunoglobulin light chain junction region [Macaca mulatta]MOV78990.1 immunoglobulin light chain junction region [Macaca mulatta]MOV79967.1 immunoglobulin light chain junction region [Macaca mulatta]